MTKPSAFYFKFFLHTHPVTGLERPLVLGMNKAALVQVSSFAMCSRVEQQNPEVFKTHSDGIKTLLSSCVPNYSGNTASAQLPEAATRLRAR